MSLRLTCLSAACIAVGLSLSGCSSSSGPDKEYVTASGLRYVILAAGHGSRPDIGDTVLVHYEVWLEGDLIDSSLDRGEPFQTPVGVGRNIQGFDEGVLLMQVGARYRLIVPPELAYGDSGAGDVIPPGATLEFEVKLVQILDR